MKGKYWLLLIVLFAGLAIWYFSHIFIYILIAAIVSLIGQPIDKFYSKHIRYGKYRLNPSLSAGLAFLTLLSLFLILGAVFLPLIMEEAKIISQLDPNAVYTNLQSQLRQAGFWLDSLNIKIGSVDPEQYVQEKVTSFLTFANVSLFLNELISTLGDFFIAVFAVSFLTFFFLRDEELIVRSVLSLFPQQYFEHAHKIWIEAENMLKRYFIGVLMEIFLVVIFLWLGLSLAGFKHALLIALFGGLMNVIPYVGPLIGAAFAFLIGVTTIEDASLISVLTKVALVFPIVNLGDAFLLQPWIYSSSVKAHPLEIFLVIMAGAAIGGIGGMVLAVPSYTVLRVAIRGVRSAIYPDSSAPK